MFYIQSEYDITFMDKSLFIKIANINNGKFKGLNEGISYEDLLYMFKQKKDFLNKIADKKRREGNEFKNGKHRLNYDLAVIINKYDDYKKWKKKQILIEASNKKDEEDNKNQIDYKYINCNASEKYDKDEEVVGVDINDILE